MSSDETQGRWSAQLWSICIVLLLASTLNYMDRQLLANVQPRIEAEFHLNNEQYGILEEWFGYAFAVGSLVFGVVADLVSIRWLYPLMILLWSAAGAATASSQDYNQLLLWRTLLGFFEAAHWPCALRTTQRVMSPADRTFANSVLQSGTSIGAIITPILILIMLPALIPLSQNPSVQELQLHTHAIESWRPPFLVIGGIGVLWLGVWQVVTRHVDLSPTPQQTPTGQDEPGWWQKADFLRQFAAIAIMVCAINIAWQVFRAWLPKFLQQGRGYSESERLLFTSVFYGASDVGCILAGWASAWLLRHRLSVGRARKVVFVGCALLCALSLGIPYLPKGPLLLGVLLIIAGGLLGLFPCYYAWSQDMSRAHSGKMVGILGALAWLASSRVQKWNGKIIDDVINSNEALVQAGQQAVTGPFDTGLALAGALPLVGAIVMCLWWKDEESAASPQPPAE